MLLLVTYKNQLTTYHVNKNIKTFIFFTTFLIFLSEQIQGMKSLIRSHMVSDKS